MANTYTQCYLHLVFAVRRRDALIHKSWKPELEKYITGIVQSHEHKMLAIGGMPDHIHVFLGYDVKQTIPKLVEEIKTSSNRWISKNNFTPYKFDWQNGYGAFTHARSQLDTVVNYVLNQEEHHKQKTFRDEYLAMLIKNEVEFKEEYLFDFFDETYDWHLPQNK